MKLDRCSSLIIATLRDIEENVLTRKPEHVLVVERTKEITVTASLDGKHIIRSPSSPVATVVGRSYEDHL